ncbi:MAG: DUF2752 domain-containing protein [Flavipsychrobacter sp.]
MPLSTKGKRFYIFISLITIIGWGWLILQYYVPREGTVCLIKNVTGYPCPSCGTTRASVAVLHGDWQLAIHHNLLGFFAVAMLSILPIWLLKDLIGKRASLFKIYVTTEEALKRNKALLIILLLLISINWIWNLFKTI